MMFKNKKGDDRYLSPWNFLMWAITGGVLAVIILFFYSAEIDVRQEQANIIALKLIDCLIDSGEYNKNFESSDFNIFSECDLNKDTIWNGDYFFHVSVYEDGRLLKENITGTLKYEKECELAKTIGGDFPKCFEYSFYALKDGRQIQIKILTASNQLGEKV